MKDLGFMVWFTGFVVEHHSWLLKKGVFFRTPFWWGFGDLKGSGLSVKDLGRIYAQHPEPKTWWPLQVEVLLPQGDRW